MRLTATTPALLKRPVAIAFILSLATLAGCAGNSVSRQASAGEQNPTLTDAQRQTRGSATARAPSQLHLGFGNREQQQQQDASEAEAAQAQQEETTLRALAEPKTFLGTVPCQTGSCTAARLSLTMAPGGHWRARMTPLDGGQQATTTQGCWNTVSLNPPRIILLQENDVILANLGFLNDNVMRVNQVHGITPSLEYRLTRQAEIDPIDELQGKPLPACSPN